MAAADGRPARADDCWLVTEPHAGMENQCRGLAEALGLDYQLRHVRPRMPWVALPPGWWWRPLRESVCGATFTPPWPHTTISCGRRAVAVALAIKQASSGVTRAVHIQNPHVALGRFDWVVAPRHDGLAGENVIQTDGALHRVTQARLAAAARDFAPVFARLPRPLVAVLVGGDTRRQALDETVAGELAGQLAKMAEEDGVGLAVTPSRRTPDAALRTLQQRLSGQPAWIWDRTGPNPYFGLLALADAIVVTGDSVSMVTEACFTGKPVLIHEFGRTSARRQSFHARMRELGCTRAFAGRLERWRYPPLDETGRVATRINGRAS